MCNACRFVPEKELFVLRLDETIVISRTRVRSNTQKQVERAIEIFSS